MKRISMIFILAFTFLWAFPPFAFAAADTETKSNVMITVVMPDAVPSPSSEPSPTPAPVPTATPTPVLYPVSVEETLDNGGRQIIKVYELSPGENPDGIRRESFERDGWRYELADITKSETTLSDEQNHTETQTIDTDTNDLNTITKQLAPTMEYKSNDGYEGVLSLDVTSVKVEAAGTKTSSFTVSATREYLGLSNEDTSLVPKTITDSGRTLKLASVQWRSFATDNIDYTQIPSSYTAVAVYTGVGSKTVVTGYTTTADYSGTISKISAGKTVFKAIFVGKEIIPEPTTFQPPDQSDVAQTSPAPSETPSDTGELAVATQTTSSDNDAAATISTPAPTEELSQANDKPVSPWPIVFAIAAVLVLLNAAVYCFFILCKKPAQKAETKGEASSKPEATKKTQYKKGRCT